MEPNSVLVTYDFKRKPNGEEFKKIVIKHEFIPIIIKKDTLIFTFESFANGNECKKKDILEKLPIIDAVKDYEIISEKELNSRIDRNRNKLSSSK